MTNLQAQEKEEGRRKREEGRNKNGRGDDSPAPFFPLPFSFFPCTWPFQPHRAGLKDDAQAESNTIRGKREEGKGKMGPDTVCPLFPLPSSFFPASRERGNPRNPSNPWPEEGIYY